MCVLAPCLCSARKENKTPTPASPFLPAGYSPSGTDAPGAFAPARPCFLTIRAAPLRCWGEVSLSFCSSPRRRSLLPLYSLISHRDRESERTTAARRTPTPCRTRVSLRERAVHRQAGLAHEESAHRRRVDAQRNWQRSSRHSALSRVVQVPPTPPSARSSPSRCSVEIASRCSCDSTAAYPPTLPSSERRPRPST